MGRLGWRRGRGGGGFMGSGFESSGAFTGGGSLQGVFCRIVGRIYFWLVGWY